MGMLYMTSGETIEWIFIHYHKTGHDFSNKLALSFASHCPNTHYVTKKLHKFLTEATFRELRGVRDYHYVSLSSLILCDAFSGYQGACCTRDVL